MKSEEISQNLTEICVLKYPSECNHIVRIHFLCAKSAAKLHQRFIWDSL